MYISEVDLRVSSIREFQLSPTRIEKTVIRELKNVSKLYLGDVPFILSTFPFESNFIEPANDWSAIRLNIRNKIVKHITNGSIDLNVLIRESIRTLSSFTLKILNILNNLKARRAENDEEELLIPTSIRETITIIINQKY